LTGERILVVDDQVENVDFIIEHVLKPSEYVPLTACDGAEGLNKALRENPDLILLDVQMPKLTGVQVLEALEEQGRNIPVILMTLYGSEDLAVRAFRLGVKDYIIKPFEASEMLEAIERALSESRLRLERDDLLDRLLSANRQLEQRIKELNILYGIGKSVTSLLDLQKLFSHLVDAAVYISGAEEGWLMLVDQGTDELYVCAARGLEEKQARTLRLRVEDSLAGAVMRSGEPIVVGSGRHKVKTAYLVKSLMAVPIKIEQRSIGVLCVAFRASDRTFSSNALYLVSAIADYAAIAIENAHLFAGIQDARARVEAILRGTLDAVLVTDEENRILLLNDAAFRVLGLVHPNKLGTPSHPNKGTPSHPNKGTPSHPNKLGTPSHPNKLGTLSPGATANTSATAELNAVVGQPVGEVIPHKELRSLFSQAAGSNVDLRTEVSLDDGRTFNAHLTPVTGVGDVVVMQDITHFKDLERLKNEFVSTVSHDLRSPLTSIRGFVDLIEMTGSLNDRQKTFAEKIREGVTVITRMITELLDLSRIEKGGKFEFTVIALNEVISESVETLRGHAASKKQRLEVALPSNLSPVMGNRLRLGQAVKNLVGNAIKYTPYQGRIRVWTEERDGQILFHVRDTGIGISAEDQTKLFQEFYRVKSPQTDEIPGTGLGLSITKSIIERHGGRIWVNSELGKGSTFTFLLPAYKSPQG
jgi:signal transduction histidine kinase/CheY-like chemotaxis protein